MTVQIKKYDTSTLDGVNVGIDEKSFADLLSSSLNSSEVGHEGQIIKGVIKLIDREKGLVCVDCGLKSETFLSLGEFFLPKEKESVKEGDEIEVFLSKLDTRSGNVGVSRAKAIKEKTWMQIKQAAKDGTYINGICCMMVRGGNCVDFNGNPGFLPGGQVSSRPTTSVAEVMAIPLEYKVLHLDENTRSFVVSRRAVLENATGGEREEFLNSINEGGVMDGVVKNIVGYGAFVDLGPVDGLLHIMDMSWSKLNHPSELLKIGQKIKVKVIRIDRETGRISLGIKQLQDNPWEALKEKYKPGTSIKGKIVNIAAYGLFVELEENVEGLLHVSELSWVNAYKQHKEMQLGQIIEAVVTEIDVARHRIALSMKRLQDNPWDKFFSTYEVGQKIDGVVRNITPFGIFVAVGDGSIDGLLHMSDLSWDKNPAAELAKYNPGDKITVVYLGKNDANGQRVRFGLKQLIGDPFEHFSGEINKGDVLTCEVVGIDSEGIDVLVQDTLRSFIKKSSLARDKEGQKPDRFTIGDKISVKVVQYSKEERKLVLSIRAQEEDEYEDILTKYGNNNVSSTLGDVIKSDTEEGE